MIARALGEAVHATDAIAVFYYVKRAINVSNVVVQASFVFPPPEQDWNLWCEYILDFGGDPIA